MGARQLFGGCAALAKLAISGQLTFGYLQALGTPSLPDLLQMAAIRHFQDGDLDSAQQARDYAARIAPPFCRPRITQMISGNPLSFAKAIVRYHLHAYPAALQVARGCVALVRLTVAGQISSRHIRASAKPSLPALLEIAAIDHVRDGHFALEQFPLNRGHILLRQNS